MNIAIFAGELSGDLIGSALAEALLAQQDGVELWGIGGSAMRAAGVHTVADSTSWSAIGVSEALRKAPALLVRNVPAVRRALSRRPSVVVLIDFGGFNRRVARFAHRRGLRVCYYFPPGSWRRTGQPDFALARDTDLIISPFEWSAQRYRDAGANAVCVGHPILERATPSLSKCDFAARFGLDTDKPIIGLLPGSRQHEVIHLMPVLAEAARMISRRTAGAQFVVAAARSIPLDLITDLLRASHAVGGESMCDSTGSDGQAGEMASLSGVARTLSRRRERLLVTPTGVVLPTPDAGVVPNVHRQAPRLGSRAADRLPPIALAEGLAMDVLAHSDVALTCSGTATLEAAVLGTPIVALYAGSRLMEAEYYLRRLHKRIRFISLPNILADRPIVPELIQRKATPTAIANAAETLLTDLSARHAVRQGLLEVRNMLGVAGASGRAARLILGLAAQ